MKGLVSELWWTDENHCRNSSARYDSKDSGISRPTFPRPAASARRLRIHGTHRLILKSACHVARFVCLHNARCCLESSARSNIFALSPCARPGLPRARDIKRHLCDIARSDFPHGTSGVPLISTIRFQWRVFKYTMQSRAGTANRCTVPYRLHPLILFAGMWR
jgi:hypothetical protein